MQNKWSNCVVVLVGYNINTYSINITMLTKKILIFNEKKFMCNNKLLINM